MVCSWSPAHHRAAGRVSDGERLQSSRGAGSGVKGHPAGEESVQEHLHLQTRRCLVCEMNIMQLLPAHQADQVPAGTLVLVFYSSPIMTKSDDSLYEGDQSAAAGQEE